MGSKTKTVFSLKKRDYTLLPPSQFKCTFVVQILSWNNGTFRPEGCTDSAALAGNVAEEHVAMQH